MMSGNSGFGGVGGDIAGILGGLFGDAGQPYEDASNTLQGYYGQATQAQNPFLKMGYGAIPGYQNWVQGQANPSMFINNLMNQYQQSPWAKFQQQQAIRAGQNMGSASGLTGSTPLLQFAQQNAQNISSQDMQNWLQNVLGINTQYGQGLQNQIGGGQTAANSLSSLAQNFGENQANLSYDQSQAQQNQQNGLWGGLIGLGTSIAGALL